jgi:Na+/phosphate symporter
MENKMDTKMNKAYIGIMTNDEQEIISDAYKKYNHLIKPFIDNKIGISLRGFADIIELNTSVSDDEKEIINILNRVDARSRYQTSHTIH